jgi:hypothetical protein
VWLLAASPVALAQPAPSVVGTWSNQQPGQGGMVQTTVGMGSDNTFAVETQLPNGSRMRIWGTFQATQLSDNTIRVVQQIVDWSPHQVCTEAPGFDPHCNAFQPPPPQPLLLTFESADSYQVDGNVWSRDPDAALLRQPVPDPLMQYAQAPSAPIMRQPVIQPPPYDPTPQPDPRQQYEQGNQNFLNGYMRGCTMIDGRWQDCQQ